MELPWLRGYEGSKPVRVGNQAYEQFQLDVFGELAATMYECRKAGLETSESGWAVGKAIFGSLEKLWREPDDGIWEVRGPRRHFTHSKMMAWVAFDRARQVGRGVPPRRPGRPLAGRSATRSTPRSAARATTPIAGRSSSITARTSSTRAC